MNVTIEVPCLGEGVICDDDESDGEIGGLVDSFSATRLYIFSDSYKIVKDKAINERNYQPRNMK